MILRLIFLIVAIILFQKTQAQPVSISLDISESGNIEIEPFYVDGISSFGGTGFTGNFSAFYQLGNISKRKIRSQQERYDRQIIIDSDSIESTELSKTKGLVFSPFYIAAASSSMAFFMPMAFMSAPDSGKVWNTYNYSTTNYNCNGESSISSYFIRYKLNQNSLPDSIYWGSAYPSKDIGSIEKPKTLWRYWFNENDNFTRIEITDLDYPEYYWPNLLRTIISFNYNVDNQLTRIITFQDTTANSTCNHADLLSKIITKSFYFDHDSINYLIDELSYPGSGQSVLSFIQYEYADKQLISSHTFSSDWAAIMKDSLVYQNNLLKEHFYFMDNSTFNLGRFAYHQDNK